MLWEASKTIKPMSRQYKFLLTSPEIFLMVSWLSKKQSVVLSPFLQGPATNSERKSTWHSSSGIVSLQTEDGRDVIAHITSTCHRFVDMRKDSYMQLHQHSKIAKFQNVDYVLLLNMRSVFSPTMAQQTGVHDKSFIGDYDRKVQWDPISWTILLQSVSKITSHPKNAPP